ncbi:hypothetical protein G5B30_00035 [Sphingobacterium sp. SGG-5]|uniref:hypothetical protein n=1 Tax=Sphingobacterium sp. SGG-5 TaxID=2710881 RepID=UPI0013EB5A26|nr:hypothetical protein [Sphingobacterium sp. SGG-5]NGM60290.1 hypothetical protein [Sphingobacterium sp. SGG-5]
MKRCFWGFVTGIFLIITNSSVHGQIGHGTSDPSKAAVVEMLSPSKGLLIPRVALTGLNSFSPIQGELPTNEAKVNSLLVYNTATTTMGTNEDVTPGYYYWTSGTILTSGRWNRLLTDNDAFKAALPRFFYMPSIIIPTEVAHIPSEFNSAMSFDNGTKIGTIDLHAIYSAQFNGISGSSIKSPGAGTDTLPVIPANELDYYITWYDNTLFDNVQVTNAGILTYHVSATTADEGSFMNIVFKVRDTPSSP